MATARLPRNENHEKMKTEGIHFSLKLIHFSAEALENAGIPRIHKGASADFRHKFSSKNQPGWRESFEESSTLFFSLKKMEIEVSLLRVTGHILRRKRDGMMLTTVGDDLLQSCSSRLSYFGWQCKQNIHSMR